LKTYKRACSVHAGKTRKIKKASEKGVNKPSINRKLLAISMTLSALIVLGVVVSFSMGVSETEVKFSLKAAIIDPLSEDEFLRNQTFVNTVTDILKRHNFDVTYYDYTQTNVEFFRKLAENNYGVILLRTHAALREGDSTVDLFTSERYDITRYSDLQGRRLLVMGKLNISGEVRKYFAFSSNFIRELPGVFPKSIVVAMGCQTLNQTSGISMAKAFCEKGATVYIGWSGWVSASHTDKEITKLIQRLFDGNEPIKNAVKNATPEMIGGTISELVFYPATDEVGNLKISDLINEAQASNKSVKKAGLNGYGDVVKTTSVKRFNSFATVAYSWLRRFSPVNCPSFNFLISSARCSSSKTSIVHFSKSPR